MSVPPDGGKLGVGTAGRTLAVVDTTRDFRTSVPAGPAATKLLGAAALATILAASTLSVALRRRRRRLAPT